MKRLRRVLAWLVPIGLLLPPLLWVAVLTIVPTDWARDKLVAELASASGLSVRLESLRLGALGGVHIKNLELAVPGAADDPWLKLVDGRLNVSLHQLAFGHVDPTELEIEGLTVRVLRHKDGTLELASLLQAPASQPAASPAPTPESSGFEPTGLNVTLGDAKITLIDESSQTRLEFANVEGHATWAGQKATLRELHGTLNGGPFELCASLDRNATAPAFEGQIKAREIALSEGMGALSYIVPLLAKGDAPAALNGKLTANIYLRGQGLALEALKSSLVGRGSVHLDPIQLDGSNVVSQLAHVLPLPAQGRVGAIKTDFEIKDGRISTDDLTLNVAKVPIVLSGWTDFDGKLEYRMKTEQLSDKMPSKAKGLLSELSIDWKDVAALKLQGSVDALVVTLDGVPLNGKSSAPPGDERQKVREIGRRLRDKLMR